MNVRDAFSDEGQARLKAEKRRLFERIKAGAPEMAGFLQEMKATFGRLRLREVTIGEERIVIDPIPEERICTMEMMMSTSIAEHKRRLRGIPCVVSGRTDHIELHHCHGGSVSAAGFRRGLGQKTSDWLIIPLHREYHTGKFNPEVIGVERWEALFGAQTDHLRALSDQLGYNVIERARGEEASCK